MDYTVHGILQARRLEWVAISSSRESSWPRSPTLQADSFPSEPLLLTLDEGYLLTAAPPDLERGVAPLGLPASVQPTEKIISGFVTYLWASQVVQLIRTSCQCNRCRFDPWVGKIPWRKKWQPTPEFLSGESHGLRSLAGYSPQGCRVGHNWAHMYTYFLHIWQISRKTE